MTTALVTGHTTPVGAALIAVLAQQSTVERIYVVGPSDTTRALDAHCRDMGKSNSGNGAKIRAMTGDPRQARFGLDQKAWGELAMRADVGFNCSEPAPFDLSLRLSRTQQLAPLQGWLELLGANERMRLAHLSSAYVAGDRQGLFTEFDLDCGQRFRTSYERVKFEAECDLKRCRHRDRIAIFRPSLVIGNDFSGAAARPVGVAALLRAVAQNRWPLVVADPSAKLDLVPVEYVANAMVALLMHNVGATGTYHLVAGDRHAISVREVFAQAHALPRPRESGPWFLPPVLEGLTRPMWRWWPRARTNSHAQIRAYRVHLRRGCVFDDFRARRALAPLGISCPPPSSYLDALFAAWQPNVKNEIH